MKHVAITSIFDKDEDHFVKAVEDLLKGHGHKVKTAKTESGYSIISLPHEDQVNDLTPPVETPPVPAENLSPEPVEHDLPVSAPGEMTVALATSEDVQAAHSGTTTIKSLSMSEQVPYTCSQEQISYLKVQGVSYDAQDAIFTYGGVQFKYPIEGTQPSSQVLNPGSIGAGCIRVSLTIDSDPTNYSVLLYVADSGADQASVVFGKDLSEVIFKTPVENQPASEPTDGGAVATNDQVSTQ